MQTDINTELADATLLLPDSRRGTGAGATVPTFRQREGLRQYRDLQATDRRTMGQRRADVEAWRNPPARVSPSITRRHDDTAPQWPQYVLMTVFSLGATWGFFMLCAHGIPAFRHFVAALWGAS